VGISLGLGLDEATIARALTRLPAPPHRAEISRTDAGVTVIDDTYNANPDGARRALEAAATLKQDGGRIWTITPGMVELGSEQEERNRVLGTLATATEDMTLVVTGRTNRRALVTGAVSPARLRTMPSRQAAARTVMAEATAGDVVLYENDLPDHYP
jgi:UDP-N-acetylmuramoyl-tripeptide--D-alanyl-D-alanine ligase